jgi:flagella basal body P-ring formation protein FlgA
VASRRVLVDQLPEAALVNREQVVGQMASRDLKQGTVMTAPAVEAVPLAKANQYITVNIERGGIRIKAVAKAMEGGCYGQTIRVKNEATKDVYQVILTGPQEGSVAAAAAAAAPPPVAVDGPKQFAAARN